MTLTVSLGQGFTEERRHAATVLLTDFLGLDIRIATEAGVGTAIEAEGRRLEIADGLFAVADADWLTERSLPQEPFHRCPSELLPGGARLADAGLPAPWVAGPEWQSDGENARLGIDVLGSAFFLLTRYEEVVGKARDEHGRFPLGASDLRDGGLLERPLVEEYAEVLWAGIHQLWPRLPRPTRSFRVFSTHDVDNPYAYSNCGVAQLPRAVAAAARARGPRAARAALRDWQNVRRTGPAADPYNTFSRMMDAEESANAGSAYYFIADPAPEGRIPRMIYRLGDPSIQDLIAEISHRGHEVGLHASYAAHDGLGQLATEAERVRAAVMPVGEDRPVGGRHHYLRWDAARSPGSWDAAGLAYDSTVGFAERPGFRTGACRPHRMWDFQSRRTLAVRERPLLMMDVSLTAPRYLGLDAASAEAVAYVDGLKETCRKFEGEFVVLWHNDVIPEPGHWELFRHAIAT